MATSHFPDYLNVYYKKLFPFSQMYKWLSYDNKKKVNFINREFSFTNLDNVYTRYKCFNSIDEFNDAIQKERPTKIDIGAVYNTSPKLHRYPQFMVIEKELVVDIDINDYDQIRTCCSAATVCKKCWRFIVIAARILERTLVDDFGWKHFFWVFSGRRGIHCWICDESARKMSYAERRAFIEYMTVLSPKNVPNVKHPAVRSSVEIIKNHFDPLLAEQDFLGTPNRIAKILSLISDFKLKKHVNLQFSKYPNSSMRWKVFTNMVDTYRRRKMLNFKNQYCVERILLYLAYPRFDVNVTKEPSHLLKAPFTAHPSTGKICVPINPKIINEFDPTTAPTVYNLIDELHDYEKERSTRPKTVDDGSTRVANYDKTSLSQPVAVFENFINSFVVQ